jgi:hypothetical protein
MKMPVASVAPDLQISLRLDDFAPRATRYHVKQVDRPSPDLRDAVAVVVHVGSRSIATCADGDPNAAPLCEHEPGT